MTDETSPPSGEGVNVCFAKCWECLFDAHYDPPKWHTWANDEDVEHAQKTGQPDPRETICGCWCARSVS